MFRLLEQAKANSQSIRKRRRDIGCTLTVQYLTGLWQRQAGLDFYTHRPLSLESFDGQPHHPDRLSLDRIDSSKGYAPGNVCLCALWVNRAKGAMTPDQLRDRLFP